MPLSDNIRSKAWREPMELRLAKLCRTAFLNYVVTPQGGRRKRVATSGDYKVQVLFNYNFGVVVPPMVLIDTIRLCYSQQK